jgi:cell wall-associated NlpC family hydrolase
MPLDPRVTLYRPDLAHDGLLGQVESARFVTGANYQVSAGVCPVRKEPFFGAEQLSQALHGDTVTVLEEIDGFGWGQMASDGYVGWFDMAALSSPVVPVTHRISALRTYVFSEPSIKSAPLFLVSLNATLAVEEREGRFVRAARAGWIVDRHCALLDDVAADPASVALRFLGSPYFWGGKESLGLDCSGLVQMSLMACGIACPRDSDMQRSVGIGVEVHDDLSGVQRNDIICWKGHVGIMLDGERLLHANAHHMETACEPLADAVARITPLSGPILTIRRP